MTFGLVFMGGIILACMYWARLIVRRREVKADRQRIHKSRSSSFACVTIKCGAEACEAAKVLVGSRFLRKNAPFLPVDLCNLGNCNCLYLHHQDRRRHDRREIYKSDSWSRLGDRRINKADRRHQYQSA